MATFGKPKPANKKKSRFGEPPAIEEASTTLEAPEHAPNNPARKSRAKTGRTIPFSTKVSIDFDSDFRETAFHNKMKHAELLEVMLEIYKKQKR